MGLILDSSVLVAAERRGQNARQALEAVLSTTGDVAVAISVVTLMELAHGVARANTQERQKTRQRFVDELASAVPLHSVTVAIAWRAGLLDGQTQARGIRIPLPDLLIGVTALDLGYAVGTSNPRHFESVPGLEVVRL